MTSERIQAMADNFWAESNDPETYEWRESLTAEEAALVAEWDRMVDAGTLAMLTEIPRETKR